MLYYTVGQWRIFLVMLPFGFAAGTWFGAVSSLGDIMRSGPYLRAACDLASALGMWLIVAAGLLAANYGEVRLYALLGAGAGFLLERATLGALNKAARKSLAKLCKFMRGRQEKKQARRS